MKVTLLLVKNVVLLPVRTRDQEDMFECYIVNPIT
jgi:hypothetical protein